MIKINVRKNEKGRIILCDFVQQIADTKLIKSDGSNLYRVNDLRNLVEKIPDARAFCRLVKDEMLDKNEANKIMLQVFENAYNELLVHSEIQFELADLVHPELLNIANGILNIRTLEFVPVDGKNKIYFPYWLDFEFIKDADQSKAFTKFLQTSVEPKDHNLFLEVLGYIISEQCGKRKAVMFLGKSGSGKSTIANLIRKVIYPSTVVGNYSLNQMSDKFNIGNIINCKINIADEFDASTVTALERFKSIVSEARFSVSKKYSDDFTIDTKTKLLFCGNKLPNTRGLDPEAIFNRLLIVNFNGLITEAARNENLLKEMYYERNLIFAAALKSFSRTYEEGFSNSTVGSMIIEQAAEEANSAEKFFEEKVDSKNPNNKIAARDLLEAYRRFCSENDWRCVSRNEFYKTFYLKGFKKVAINFNGTSTRQGFHGIGLKTEE